MGAAQDKFVCVAAGGIMIHVDNPSYRPGDTVRGDIFINMAQSFSTNCLNLSLKVEQYTRFRDKFTDDILKNLKQGANNPSKFSKLSEYREGYKILFDSTKIIATFNQTLIAPGHYQYPFSFILPLNLPGSFEYYDQNSVAYTTYILETSLPSKNSHNIIKNSVLLIVNQPLQSLGISRHKENTSKLKTWCCLSQGSSTLKVQITKDKILTIENIISNCEIDNRNTDLNGNNLKVVLIQQIILRDNFGRVKSLERIISQMNYRNIYRSRETSRFTIELIIYDQDNPTLKNLNKCNHVYLLKHVDLVSRLQASIKSELIECSYILRLKTFYDSKMITSRTPELDIPLALYIPDIRLDIQDYLPSGWNPKVSQILNFDFPLPTAEELGIQNTNLNEQGQL